MPIDGDQNVPDQNAATLGRTVLINFDDEQAMLLRTTSALSRRERDQLAADAQVATLDIAMFRQRISNTLSDSYRYRQRDAVHQSGSQDAKNMTLYIDERPSREAGIRGRIGANVAFEYHASPRP